MDRIQQTFVGIERDHMIERSPVNVTKTFLPPLEDYNALLSDLWKSGLLTNNGVLLQRLEESLRSYLGAPGLLAVSNGTVALQLAIRALDLKGEVIVTPFSYVATVSSAVWESLDPVFADINAQDLTIDPSAIEEAITPRTQAILATHVFGNPCDIEAIEAIAQRHGLRVIYDGAHAFGVRYKGSSICQYGDCTTLSFHATKLFHTIEGGATIAKDPEVFRRLSYMRNFGHDGPEAFQGIGINGKMSEVHAAMGVLVLDHMEFILNSRKEAWIAYWNAFVQDERTHLLQIRNGTEYNYAYFPMVFGSEALLLKVKKALEAQLIFPRRYFYPSLDTLPYVGGANCAISRSIASRILCLPLYAGMEEGLVERIASIVNGAI